jgi:hypothetical protein
MQNSSTVVVFLCWNVWRYTSTPQYVFKVRYLVKHRGKFTLPYLTLNYLTILVLSYLHVDIPGGHGFQLKLCTPFPLSMRATRSTRLNIVDLGTVRLHGEKYK